MNPELLQAHAQEIRASGMLGRSELMQRLFDFLVSCTLAGKAPKEIELAIDVFGRTAGFEVTRDAMVRVYIHKLRRKLEDYYAARQCDDGHFVIPLGEYRLVFEEHSRDASGTQRDDAATANSFVPEPTVTECQVTQSAPCTEIAIGSPATISMPVGTADIAAKRKSWRSWPVIVAIAATFVFTNVVWLFARSTEYSDLDAVRADPVWQAIANDAKPVYLVMGDYYIFGELAADSPSEPESVRRLVREFNVNSRNDLEQWFKDHPERADRYMDLALSYLPTSSAYTLADIAPVIHAHSRPGKQVQVIMASELTPTMIRSSHIVYIGLISGMGILRDIAFSGSKFRIGDTYDELIDRDSGQLYVSQSSVSVNDNTRYRDYGYFSTFDGPAKNRIVVLAGTRDVALMHVAEAVSHARSLRELTQTSRAADNFEALYAVDAIDRMNLDGRLLIAQQLDPHAIWNGGVTAKVSGIVALQSR